MKCQPGYFSENPFNPFRKCPYVKQAKKYSPASCESCPYGQIVNADRSGCISCPASYYAPSISQEGLDDPYGSLPDPVCTKCPSGTWSKGGEYVNCRMCLTPLTGNANQTGCVIFPELAYLSVRLTDRVL